MNQLRAGRFVMISIAAAMFLAGLVSFRMLGLRNPQEAERGPQSGPPADRASLSSPSPAEQIAAGREQFTRVRHAEPRAVSAVTHPRLFNARSCAECHRQAGIGGGGPKENNVQLLTPLALRRDAELRGRLGAGFGTVVLHRQGLSPEYGVWRAALLKSLEPKPEPIPGLPLAWVDAMSVPTKPLERPDRDLLEARNTPPLFGLGLIDAIPQSAIDDVAARQHENIRGRSPRLKGGGFGRFGWKSSTATLAAFNENACAVELGLTTPAFTPATFRPADVQDDDDVLEQNAPIMRAAAPRVPDMSASDVVALTRYVASLPAPRQVIDPDKREQVAAGERHFAVVGCADCHTPQLGGVTGIYSDLLLHSVGTSGSAFYGDPSRPPGGGSDFDIVKFNEFRTPPLWGVADSGPYLHDGGAATLDAAILAHREEAHDSRFAYEEKLAVSEQQALLAFLESLRAP